MEEDIRGLILSPGRYLLEAESTCKYGELTGSCQEGGGGGMGTMGGGSGRYQLPILEGLSRGEGKAQHQEYNGVVRALSGDRGELNVWRA